MLMQIFFFAVHMSFTMNALFLLRLHHTVCGTRATRKGGLLPAIDYAVNDINVNRIRRGDVCLFYLGLRCLQDIYQSI